MVGPRTSAVFVSPAAAPWQYAHGGYSDLVAAARRSESARPLPGAQRDMSCKSLAHNPKRGRRPSPVSGHRSAVSHFLTPAARLLTLEGRSVVAASYRRPGLSQRWHPFVRLTCPSDRGGAAPCLVCARADCGSITESSAIKSPHANEDRHSQLSHCSRRRLLNRAAEDRVWHVRKTRDCRSP
jgi:hypothetical protein